MKVSIDTPSTLSDLYDNVGQGDETAPIGRTLDTSLHSLSIQQLAANGIAPGAKIAVGGFIYTWPNVAKAQPDNYVTAGDRIALPDAAGATRIGLLGTATNGPSTATATVTYSDGSTSQAPVQFGDWVGGFSGGQPMAGDRLVVKMTKRTNSSGAENATTMLYSDAIPLTPGKTAVSLTIPAASAGQIHVFDLQLDTRGALPFEQLLDSSGITSDAQHAADSLDWTGHALSLDALAAAGVTPGAKVSANGLAYTWPNVPAPASATPPVRPDHVEVAGQEIALPAMDGATKIGFLLTAIKGPATTTAQVMYGDGSTSSANLSISDWTPGSLQAGNTVAIDTAHRATTAGTDTTHADVYSVTVPVTAGKTPLWVRLTSPTSGSAAIHLFAVAIDGTPSQGGGTPTPTPTPTATPTHRRPRRP